MHPGHRREFGRLGRQNVDVGGETIVGWNGAGFRAEHLGSSWLCN